MRMNFKVFLSPFFSLTFPFYSLLFLICHSWRLKVLTHATLSSKTSFPQNLSPAFRNLFPAPSQAPKPSALWLGPSQFSSSPRVVLYFAFSLCSKLFRSKRLPSFGQFDFSGRRQRDRLFKHRNRDCHVTSRKLDQENDLSRHCRHQRKLKWHQRVGSKRNKKTNKIFVCFCFLFSPNISLSVGRSTSRSVGHFKIVFRRVWLLRLHCPFPIAPEVTYWPLLSLPLAPDPGTQLK